MLTARHHIDNIEKLWTAEIMEEINRARDNNETITFQKLLPLLLQAQKTIRAKPECRLHGKHCELETAKSHWAGPSCTDFSPMGQGKKLDGKTMVAMCAWLAHRRFLG